MKIPIIRRIQELFGLTTVENASDTADDSSLPKPRRKAMYLNVLIGLRESELADPQALMDSVAEVISTALAVGTAAGLTGEIKRVRMAENPPEAKPTVDVLLHVQGDQPAPMPFLPLAESEIRALLEMILQTALPGGLSAAITAIEENPNAVDELADEGLA